MRLARRHRIVVVAFTAILTFALTLPAWAHARPWRHNHRKTVVVVAQPKPVRHEVVVRGPARGTLDMNVKPAETEVYVDGTYRGTCDELDGYPNKLNVVAGKHTLTLVTPDGVEVSRDIQVRAGVEMNIGLDLR